MDDEYMKPGGSTARRRKTKRVAKKASRAAKKYGRTSTRRTHRGHVQKK
jgi:hypothetical protein